MLREKTTCFKLLYLIGVITKPPVQLQQCESDQDGRLRSARPDGKQQQAICLFHSSQLVQGVCC